MTLSGETVKHMDDILSPEQEEILKRTRDTLGQLRDMLADAGATQEDRTALADSIRQLDELFLLVVAGEFNSGKSSFINALIGHPLLSEGVTPTTSQIYLLKYGPGTEQKPVEKGVWEQTAPVEFLKRINIVDTPGTNAIIREHEALTAEFIPRSDLVLFVTSADRPFTESERQFLERIQEWGKKIVLIINKADILTSDADTAQVTEFVTQAARTLLGTTPQVFAVSAKQAQSAKSGEPRYWETSGFQPVEEFIHNTLDDDGRFRLKLLNPLGVGLNITRRQLALAEADVNSLKRDSQLLEDIEGQTTYYNADMQRNFQGRLGEINNLLFEMEARGREFFDENLRLGRIPDLIRKDRIQREFEQEVVGDTPDMIERRVGELVDWMVEQDLRQWSAVAEHLARRKDEYETRIVGQGGPKEGTLAYDRQRLVESIGASTRQAIASYDRRTEAEHMASVARSAVVETGLALGGAGLGAAVAAFATASLLDVTGIVAGVASLALGLLILPARKRKATQELEDKLGEVRARLVSSLTEQFEREMRRSAQRVEDTVAPFARFVRSEQDRLESQRDQLEELEAHLIGLRSQLGA